MNKKVLIVGPAYPLRGGLSTFNQILCSELNLQNYDAQILTFSLQYPKFLFPGKTQLSSDNAPKDIKINVELNSINPFNWIKVGLKYRTLKFDYIVFRFWLPFMGPCFGVLSRILKWKTNSTIIAITDNIFPHEKRPFDRLFSSFFLKSCSKFLAMSKSVQQDVFKIIPNANAVYHVHPIYNSFNKAMEQKQALDFLKLDQNYKYILFFGFIRAYKGLDLLLEAALLDQFPKDVKIIVAGEFYEPETKYQELINHLSTKQIVHWFTNFIPDSEVHYYFSASDLVVQPYKNATQSGVTQVAYFYNKPMIVTNVGGLTENVPDGEVGFISQVDAVDICNNIIKFFKLNHNQIELMKANIIKESKQYSWDSFIKKLLK